MRDRMERLVLLPFAAGCMSESSVGVTSSPPARRPRAPVPRSPPIIRNGETEREESDAETSSNEGTKSSSSLSLPKPNISTGIHRMFKGFKNIPHLFAVYKEDLDDEEMDIEIGLPTDVKHVTHIGWDGCSLNSDHPMKGCGWDNLLINSQLLCNRDLSQQLGSPGPTAPSPEQFKSWPGRRQDPPAVNPAPKSEPIPLKS